VSSTNHLAPRYAISSIPPLPRPSYVQINKTLENLIMANSRDML